jgi:type II secretory pathway predicted ATPase ExeA
MYAEYFELREKAFGNTPDPRFLYPCRQHQEALARLEYSVEEKGIALITGEIGTGKTTVSRALMDSLDKQYKPVLFLNPRFAPAQFLRTLAQKLEIKPKHVKSEVVEQIHDKLYEYYERSITPVVIIDEAQLIPGKTLFDEIRLLTNFQLDHTNLLSVILIGQPELARRLLHPAHSALNQRITIRFHLRPLEERDVFDYLQFRWITAGGTESNFPFPPLTVTKIHSYSGGIPRLINSLATTCLIDALAKEVREIDPAMVDQQAAEIGLQIVSMTKLGERHGRHGRSAQAR